MCSVCCAVLCRDMVAPMGVEVVTDFETNPHGTPYLKSMFRHVEHHGSSKMFG